MCRAVPRRSRIALRPTPAFRSPANPRPSSVTSTHKPARLERQSNAGSVGVGMAHRVGPALPGRRGRQRLPWPRARRASTPVLRPRPAVRHRVCPQWISGHTLARSTDQPELVQEGRRPRQAERDRCQRRPEAVMQARRRRAGAPTSYPPNPDRLTGPPQARGRSSSRVLTRCSRATRTLSVDRCRSSVVPLQGGNAHADVGLGAGPPQVLVRTGKVPRESLVVIGVLGALEPLVVEQVLMYLVHP
jgi:hypothetical protein